MKILIAIHDFLPRVRAGSQLYSYYLARELQNCGMEVELLFAENAEERRVERRSYAGLECTVLHKPAEGWGLFAEEDEWVDRVFAECLDRFRPHVLHLNHLLHLSTNMPRMAQERNVRVVVTLHDYWIRCPRSILLDSTEALCEFTTTAKCTRCCREFYTRYPIFTPRRGALGALDFGKTGAKLALSTLMEGIPAYRKMRRRERGMIALKEYVDLWIAPSEFLRDAMLAWGLPRDKLRFVRNGLDTRLFGGARARHRNGRVQFGYVGTISRHKGVHVLLEAFRGFTGADLAIYGPRAAPFYLNYGDVLAQGNVHVKGIITDEDKAEAYAAMDALIVPSIWFENAPLVIQEAFLAGVPVICSDIGGMRELVRDSEDGFHFRTGSARDLRRVIESCVEQPERLRGLTPRGQLVVTIEEHVRGHLVPLYEALLKSRGVVA